LEKYRGKVGQTNRVALLVVIREEPSHRSSWALNQLPLAEGKKVGGYREKWTRFGPIGVGA